MKASDDTVCRVVWTKTSQHATTADPSLALGVAVARAVRVVRADLVHGGLLTATAVREALGHLITRARLLVRPVWQLLAHLVEKRHLVLDGRVA
eukprot:5421038-Prymnesium_polylepis.1